MYVALTLKMIIVIPALKGCQKDKIEYYTKKRQYKTMFHAC